MSGPRRFFLGYAKFLFCLGHSFLAISSIIGLGFRVDLVGLQPVQ